MNRVLRIKGISNAMGIRRSIVHYGMIKSADFVLNNVEYPLKNLKFSLGQQNDSVFLTFNNEKTELINGVEQSFKKTRVVKGLFKDEMEYIEIDFMLLPLDVEAIKYYQDSIDKGYVFDEKNGEFTYIIGLIYQANGDIEKSNIYFNKAKEEGFK